MHKKNYTNENIFVIAGILLVFLRELPECLFINPINFIEAEKSGEEWKVKAQLALEQVPTLNVLLLQRILEMLRSISQNHSITNVTAEQLAEIFAPCLFFSTDPNEALLISKDSQDANSFFTKLIQQKDCLNFTRLPTKSSKKKKKLFSSSRKKVDK
eukprot:TRINITY_DN2397_c0_g1_i4.p1 TRINITY_DN2397_c0_g1~~TRINITY_DN2397_c0_g1_i4.p1  ORF type:complete len:157 (+),score=27.34 TRINITY_DN2397_c0_g1_i4:269-739(+)